MSDPWGYSQLGYAISSGNFLHEDPNNIFVHRLGPTLLAGIMYALLGINIITTNLPTLFSALIIIAVIWLALPNIYSRVIGCTLCITNVTFFQMSANLYPDFIAAAFMSLSILILNNRERISCRRFYWFVPVFAVLSLFFAFLAKLSAYWALPIWIVTFVLDIRAQRMILLRRFYLPSSIAGIILGSIYLIYNQLAWGHPLVRFINASEMVEAGLWAIQGPEAGEALRERLTTGAVSFLFQNYGIVLVPATLSLFFLPSRLRMWGWYSVLTLLLFWFGTTSTTSYQPMPLVDRMVIPGLPGFCILAGYFVTHFDWLTLKMAKYCSVLASTIVLYFSLTTFNTYIESWKDVRWYDEDAITLLKRDIGEEPSVRVLIISFCEWCKGKFYCFSDNFRRYFCKIQYIFHILRSECTCSSSKYHNIR